VVVIGGGEALSEVDSVEATGVFGEDVALLGVGEVAAVAELVDGAGAMAPESPSSRTARPSSWAAASGSCTDSSATAFRRGLTFTNSSCRNVL
jgi:hypothetical protein